jgi:predicted DCC family thiol-disulfide oxidoreductase YuxK
MDRIEVYYNSACPVCNAGIKGQMRRRLDSCPVEIRWIDIHSHPEALRKICAPQEFVRERLHVRDEKGEVWIGADAFRALWARTPGQGLLAEATGLPVVHRIANWSYDVFAALLYAWNRARRRW